LKTYAEKNAQHFEKEDYAYIRNINFSSDGSLFCCRPGLKSHRNLF